MLFRSGAFYKIQVHFGAGLWGPTPPPPRRVLEGQAGSAGPGGWQLGSIADSVRGLSLRRHPGACGGQCTGPDGLELPSAPPRSSSLQTAPPCLPRHPRLPPPCCTPLSHPACSPKCPHLRPSFMPWPCRPGSAFPPHPSVLRTNSPLPRYHSSCYLHQPAWWALTSYPPLKWAPPRAGACISRPGSQGHSTKGC